MSSYVKCADWVEVAELIVSTEIEEKRRKKGRIKGCFSKKIQNRDRMV